MPKNVFTPIEAKLALPADISDELKEEILQVLKSTRFSKISIPLSTYRYLVDSSVKADEKPIRVTTVGYIRKFNAETNVFTVVLFNNSTYKDTIESFTDPVIELGWSEFKDKLGTITKFVIAPGDDIPESESN